MNRPLSARAILLPMGLCLALVARAAPPERVVSGDILVANTDPRAGASSGIVKIDPVTGNQTVLSKGGFFVAPNDVVVGPDKLYVADSAAFNNVGAVLSVGIQSK